MWYVAAVGNVPDACQRHLLCEGLTKAGQALRDFAAQQGGSTTRLNVILNHPLKRPDRQAMQGSRWCKHTLSTVQDHACLGVEMVYLALEDATTLARKPDAHSLLQDLIIADR